MEKCFKFAIVNLCQMIKWRETNKMETILTEDNEDFTKFDTEFRGYIEGCDLGKLPWQQEIPLRTLLV